VRVTVDFGPFREASGLLYAGTWVAERFAALGDFIRANTNEVNPIVASIIMAVPRTPPQTPTRAVIV